MPANFVNVGTIRNVKGTGLMQALALSQQMADKANQKRTIKGFVDAGLLPEGSAGLPANLIPIFASMTAQKKAAKRGEAFQLELLTERDKLANLRLDKQLAATTANLKLGFQNKTDLANIDKAKKEAQFNRDLANAYTSLSAVMVSPNNPQGVTPEELRGVMAGLRTGEFKGIRPEIFNYLANEKIRKSNALGGLLPDTTTNVSRFQNILGGTVAPPTEEELRELEELEAKEKETPLGEGISGVTRPQEAKAVARRDDIIRFLRETGIEPTDSTINALIEKGFEVPEKFKKSAFKKGQLQKDLLRSLSRSR